MRSNRTLSGLSDSSGASVLVIKFDEMIDESDRIFKNRKSDLTEPDTVRLDWLKSYSNFDF